MSDLLQSLIIVSEKAANIARTIRQDGHLFDLLIQQKGSDEANPRFLQDFKTLADVLIQEIVRWETGNSFPELRDFIYGEENNVFRNKLGESVRVEVKETREQTATLLKSVLDGDGAAADLLAVEVHRNISFDEVAVERPRGDLGVDLGKLGVWIDPIDSTAEYINGIEEMSDGISVSGLKCVTVLIGVFDREKGVPIMGVVNQPFYIQEGEGWRGRCFWATPYTSNLTPSPSKTNIICVSSSEDPQIISKLKTSGYKIVEAAGAGYKILTVITCLSDAYLLTKDSTYKWDTCGPQAILRSLGGDIATFDQKPLPVNYNQTTNCNYGGIVAYRDPRVLEKITKCLQ